MQATLSSMLTKTEVTSLLELINRSLYCTTEDMMRDLIKNLRSLVEFDFAVCGYATLEHPSDNIQSYSIINVSYPEEWLKVYAMRKYYEIDPVVKENFTRYQIQFWSDTYKKYKTPKNFISVAEDYRLNAGYTCGIKNPAACAGSLFSFGGPSIEYHPRTDIILQQIAPHFHHSLVRIGQRNEADTLAPLSGKEIEVLNWVKYGKSSWDISRILGISDKTVNYHLGNIMKKLDTSNRTHAVAVAIRNGLIGLD